MTYLAYQIMDSGGDSALFSYGTGNSITCDKIKVGMEMNGFSGIWKSDQI